MLILTQAAETEVAAQAVMAEAWETIDRAGRIFSASVELLPLIVSSVVPL